MKPHPFNVNTYLQWHDAEEPADAPLADNINAMRDDLKAKARDDLSVLLNVLTSMFAYTENEILIQKAVRPSFFTSLQQALVSNPAPHPSYELLFKSFDSIVNKMWRKAEDKPKPTVTMANVLDKITDLIRTEVRTDNLEFAHFLAERMNHLPAIIPSDPVRDAYNDRIVSSCFEPEMKMASGYFAYHGLVKFKAGYSVEVQIYSNLTSEWRRLSHMLYEQVRIKPIAHHEFATAESRLIALGHSLYLAECEIQRLSAEIKKH